MLAQSASPIPMTRRTPAGGRINYRKRIFVVARSYPVRPPCACFIHQRRARQRTALFTRVYDGAASIGRWPRRNYGWRFRIRAAAGAKRRLLWTEAVIAIEIAAAQSRMSSSMGKYPSLTLPFKQYSCQIRGPFPYSRITEPARERLSPVTLSVEACANVIKNPRTRPSTDNVPRRTG
jgi:hypothetical protein